MNAGMLSNLVFILFSFPRKSGLIDYENGRSSDLLNPHPPSRSENQWHNGYGRFYKLTAAGLSGIFTRFPFNGKANRFDRKITNYDLNIQNFFQKTNIEQKSVIIIVYIGNVSTQTSVRKPAEFITNRRRMLHNGFVILI